MSNVLFALLFFAIALWQFFVTYQSFQKIHAGSSTTASPFASLGLWFSLFFGLLMLFLSIMIVSGQMGQL
ncbi:immunity protein [Lacticaseibacillus pantheris]|uniref:immunity protein n=1 Tax=Lacticaseibacillus pantheris TaxID=171523 RepID=UPI002595780E|nr:immunity protein [Lacticaseibacillus pantheris]WKF84912.1 immunity protein [Lacticaseibacillus pantheris]